MSIDYNSSIFDKIYSICSLFFIAASFTILLNVPLSSAKAVTGFIALIDAALGALYKRANSPNDSPGIYVFNSLSLSYPGNFL